MTLCVRTYKLLWSTPHHLPVMSFVLCFFNSNVFTQLIPGISSVPFYTTLIPLVGVLAVTAIKDAFDDIVSPFFMSLSFNPSHMLQK